MSDFHIWRDDPPPPETVVMAKYALTANGPDSSKWKATWQLVRTCRCHKPCSVYPVPSDGMGALRLPKYWREPTQEEISNAAGERSWVGHSPKQLFVAQRRR